MILLGKNFDLRIRTLIENCVVSKERSFFVIIGYNARDRVANLHHMLLKATIQTRTSVLWCYAKELYLSSNKKKRLKQIKKMTASDLLNPNQEDSFSSFIASTNIRYCYYSETHKILGNTFSMCVMQDFEYLTPGLLARSVETVIGGGIIVILSSKLDLFSNLLNICDGLKEK
jgi:N-acetyltransferase 10